MANAGNPQAQQQAGQSMLAGPMQSSFGPMGSKVSTVRTATPNVYQQSAGNLGAASTAAQGASQYQPMTAADNMGRYQNPYQQQVIDNTLQDMNRARQMTLNDVGASATQAGAFGGSRHGLVEAETNRNFFDRVGNMSAQMNQQGFNTALGAGQFDAQQDLAGVGTRLNAAGTLGNLSNLGFGMGQQIQSDQMRQGQQQQMMMQQLIDAGRQQYQGFTNAPQQSLNAPLAAIGGVPTPQSTTTTNNPGLLNYLSLGLGLL